MKSSIMSENVLPVLTLKSANLLLKESVLKSKHSCTSTTSDFDLDDDCVNIFQNGFWNTVESKNHQITNHLQKSQSPVTSDLGDSNRGSSPEEESIIFKKQSPDHISKKDDAIIPNKVSLLGVDSLWVDCMFIPADWG